jgi:hypothetical protein
MKNMNKKLILLMAVSLFCVFNLSVAEAQVMDQNGREISRPTVLPSSPFYFLKNIGREIQTLFTLDPIKKAELRLDFADQKIIELQKLIKTKNPKKIGETLDNYVMATEAIREATGPLGKENPDNLRLADTLIEKVFIHQQILAQFDDSIGGQKLENAKNKSAANFTISIFNIASAETVAQKIEADINSNLALRDVKMQILNGMYANAPVDYKKEILKIQNDLLNQ